MKLTKIRLTGMIAGVFMIIFLGFIASDYDANNSSETSITVKENPSIEIHNTEEELTEKENLATNLVQEYNGVDNQGASISYLLGQIISSKYSDAVIYDSTTVLGWGAYADPNKPDLYGVTFNFKSKADEFSFLWYVDLQTHEIYGVGGGAKEVLNIVNFEK